MESGRNDWIGSRDKQRVTKLKLRRFRRPLPVESHKLDKPLERGHNRQPDASSYDVHVSDFAAPASANLNCIA